MPRNCHRAGERAPRSSTALRSTVAGSRIRSETFLLPSASIENGETGTIPYWGCDARSVHRPAGTASTTRPREVVSPQDHARPSGVSNLDTHSRHRHLPPRWASTVTISNRGAQLAPHGHGGIRGAAMPHGEAAFDAKRAPRRQQGRRHHRVRPRRSARHVERALRAPPRVGGAASGPGEERDGLAGFAKLKPRAGREWFRLSPQDHVRRGKGDGVGTTVHEPCNDREGAGSRFERIPGLDGDIGKSRTCPRATRTRPISPAPAESGATERYVATGSARGAADAATRTSRRTSSPDVGAASRILPARAPSAAGTADHHRQALVAQQPVARGPFGHVAAKRRRSGQPHQFDEGRSKRDDFDARALRRGRVRAPGGHSERGSDEEEKNRESGSLGVRHGDDATGSARGASAAGAKKEGVGCPTPSRGA